MTIWSNFRVLKAGTAQVQRSGYGGSVMAVSGVSAANRSPLVQSSLSRRSVSPPAGGSIERMAPEPSAYEEILIGSLLDIRLRIRGALTLKIERENESYVAKCDELNELGYGPDPSNAVQDIRLTIAGLILAVEGGPRPAWRRLGRNLAKAGCPGL